MECSVSFGADAFTVDGIAALRREGYSLREIADSGVAEMSDGDPVSFGMIGKVGWRQNLAAVENGRKGRGVHGRQQKRRRKL